MPPFQNVLLKIAAISDSKVAFQIMSDLHLEINQQYQSFHIPKNAPNLILAGDIGRLSDYKLYVEFLKIQCRQFSRVFLVLGNHEFYGLSRQEGLQRAKLLEQEPDLSGILVVLNRTRIASEACPGITLLGCTLQSRILPEAREIVNKKIKDFQRIANWTVDDHLAEHSLDVDWLRMQIRQIRSANHTSGHRIIVVSHHAPCLEQSSRPADLEKPWSSAFGTDIFGSDNTEFSDVQVWIFGHTHFCTEFWKGSVKLVSNQRGYIIPQSSTEKARCDYWQSLKQRWRAVSGENNPIFHVEKIIKV